MSKHTRLSPLSATVGAAFIASVAGGQALAADTNIDNPFAMTALSSGYRVADAGGKSAEGNCGASKQAQSAKTDGDPSKHAKAMAKGEDDADKGAHATGAAAMETAPSAPRKGAEGQCGGAK